MAYKFRDRFGPLQSQVALPLLQRQGSANRQMVYESVNAKSQTLLITVCLTLWYRYPIILDTFFVYFGQLVLFFFLLFFFFFLSLIIIIIIVSSTAVRGQLMVISCKTYVRCKWGWCCYDKKKNSPCPTHHFFPKTGLPRHKPLHRFSFRGDNNQEFKWSARLY